MNKELIEKLSPKDIVRQNFLIYDILDMEKPGNWVPFAIIRMIMEICLT